MNELSKNDILNLCQQGRGPTVEFLPESTAPPKLAETLMALANARGGTLLVGAETRSGQLQGVKDIEAARERVLQAIPLCDPPLIIPLPQTATLKDKTILVIIVPPGLPHVYNLEGRYLIRDGTENKPIPASQLTGLLMERGQTGFESLVTPGATLDDITWDKVERYLNSLEGVVVSAPEEALHKRGCLALADGGYQPTNAGLLLFGREPERFLKSNEIVLVRYAGQDMGDEFLREDIQGTLPDQIRRAEAFLVSNISKGVRLASWERQERTEYPLKAVREAIVNAVAHRDYSIRGEGIRVLMFNDRLEFYSPGRLPGHVTVDNIADERFSRNQVIVQVLADMGFIERLGYGIDRMMALMQDYDLPKPVFQETANGFTVILYGPGESLVSATKRWAHLHLNERQEKALTYLTEQGRITNREYQELCPDVSPETIRRDLADLVDRNLLLKIGEKRGTFYIFK